MKEATHRDLRCMAGGCPAVFEDGDDYVIIGTLVEHPKAGPGEAAIRIPKVYFDQLN